MRVWAKVYRQHKIMKDVVREFPTPARALDSEDWRSMLIELAKPLDLACPILLEKHINELRRFRRTVFVPTDFIESVAFDRFEVELFPEKKQEKNVEYVFE